MDLTVEQCIDALMTRNDTVVDGLIRDEPAIIKDVLYGLLGELASKADDPECCDKRPAVEPDPENKLPDVKGSAVVKDALGNVVGTVVFVKDDNGNVTSVVEETSRDVSASGSSSSASDSGEAQAKVRYDQGTKGIPHNLAEADPEEKKRYAEFHAHPQSTRDYTTAPSRSWLTKTLKTTASIELTNLERACRYGSHILRYIPSKDINHHPAAHGDFLRIDDVAEILFPDDALSQRNLLKFCERQIQYIKVQTASSIRNVRLGMTVGSHTPKLEVTYDRTELVAYIPCTELRSRMDLLEIGTEFGDWLFTTNLSTLEDPGANAHKTSMMCPTGDFKIGD